MATATGGTRDRPTLDPHRPLLGLNCSWWPAGSIPTQFCHFCSFTHENARKGKKCNEKVRIGTTSNWSKNFCIEWRFRLIWDSSSAESNRKGESMKIVRFRRPWKSVHVQFLAKLLDPNKWWEGAKSKHFWKSIWEQQVRLWPKHQQISPAKHIHQRFLYRYIYIYNSGKKNAWPRMMLRMLESSKLWSDVHFHQLDFSTLQNQRLQTSFSDMFHDWFSAFLRNGLADHSTSGSRAFFFNRQLARRAGRPPPARLTIGHQRCRFNVADLQHFLGWKYDFQTLHVW